MGFLGKARRMIGGGGPVESPKPQYYQVTCAEGHVIRGERTEGYQALRCPHCGDGVFVLPRSPLPLPPVPNSARTKVRAARRPDPEAFDDLGIELTEAPPQEDLEEIQWVDPVELERVEPLAPVPDFEPEIDFSPDPEPIPAPPPVSTPRPRPKAKVKPAGPAPRPADPPSPTSRPIRPTAADRPAADDDAGPGRIAVARRPKRRGPLILVLVIVPVLAAGTIVYRLWKKQLEELPRIAEINAAEGKEALERGRFDEAKVKLARAANAYRRLKSVDEVATEAIQLADEAAILADLGRASPEEIVEEVARLGDPDGIEKFNLIYQGQAILVDSDILAVTPSVDLAYRIYVGRGPVAARTGRYELNDFELLKARDFKPNDHVIFGARLESIRIEGGEWRITLQPRSGVWMTNAKALAAGMLEAPPS